MVRFVPFKVTGYVVNARVAGPCNTDPLVLNCAP